MHMTNEEYNEYIRKKQPRSPLGMDVLRAFLVGGLICAGGEGLFACGGKLIPIQWGCDSEDSPFWFKTMDGEELELGVGNTYIAITQPDSKIVYE